MQTWSPGSPLAERFWSLAEAAERRATIDRSRPVVIARHVLRLLRALDAGRSGGAIAPTTRAFLETLAGRESWMTAAEHNARDLVFSVGVFAFELLTGTEPSAATEAPRRLGHLSVEDLMASIEAATQLPTALRSILIGAVGTKENNRYASIAPFRAELEWLVVAEEDAAFIRTSPTPVVVPVESPTAVDIPSVVIHPRAMRRSGREMEQTATISRSQMETLLPTILTAGRDLSTWVRRVMLGAGLVAVSAFGTALAMTLLELR